MEFSITLLLLTVGVTLSFSGILAWQVWYYRIKVQQVPAPIIVPLCVLSASLLVIHTGTKVPSNWLSWGTYGSSATVALVYLVPLFSQVFLATPRIFSPKALGSLVVLWESILFFWIWKMVNLL